jgi:hypothetical protein
VEILGRCVLAVLIHLAFVASLDMSDTVPFHCQPIIASSHNLSSQEGSVGMGSHQSCVHLLNQSIGFLRIYTSQESGVMSPLIQNLSAQEELESHSSDVLLLIFGRPRWILPVLDEALNIVIPRLVVYLHLDIHAFFYAHAVCRDISSLDPQWSHIIPFY